MRRRPTINMKNDHNIMNALDHLGIIVLQSVLLQDALTRPGWRPNHQQLGRVVAAASEAASEGNQRSEVKAQQSTSRIRTSASINQLTAQFTLLRLLCGSVAGPPRFGWKLRRKVKR